MYSNRMPVWFQNIKDRSLTSLKSLVLILTLIVLGWQDASASHLVGGDLTYEYLGNDRYKVVLVVRRDCKLAFPDALFDDPASIGIFDADGNLVTDLATGGQILIPFNGDDTLNQILINRCTVTIDDVCVHETRYEMIVNLPFRTGGYWLTYQRCCRNRSLNNVNDPLNTGMSLFVRLSEEAMQLGNSTPTFDAWAPIYICANERIEFNHTATDKDGDSLVYRLSTPWVGGTRAVPRPQPPAGPPYDHITWTSSIYSQGDMLGNPDDALQVDPATGFLTGTPEIIGQFVIGLCVDEYRNGVLLSTVHRDFQYNVRDCNLDIRAIITSPDAYCGDLTAYFTNGNTNAEFTKWYFDFDGDTTATSREESPSYTYPAYGQFRVALIAGLNGLCFDTTYKTITVFEGGLNAGIGWQPVDCANNDLSIQLLDQTVDEEGTPVEWLWTVTYGTTELTFTDQNPTFNLPNGTLIDATLKVTSTSGCVATTTRSFIANFFDTELLADSAKVCVGDTVTINPFKNSIPDGVFFNWDPSPFLIGGLDQIMPTFYSADIQNVTLYYTTNNGNGCFYSDSILVRVLFKPDLQFQLSNECGLLSVDVNNTSTGTESFIWNFTGTDTVISDRTFTYTFPAEGTYTVILSTMDGCMNSISQEITLLDGSEVTKNIKDSIYGCFGDVIELNPGGDTSYQYTWSPAELFDDPHAVNPTIVLDSSLQITVMIALPDEMDCIIERKVELVNTALAALARIKDTIDACPDTPTPLNPDGVGGFTYQWSPADGLDNPTAINPLATSTKSRLYMVTVTDINDANCTASKPVYFRIAVTDALDAIGDTTETCFNREEILNPNGNPDLIYTWSPADLFDDPNAVSPTIAVDTQTIIHVHIADTMGCEAEKDVVLWIPVLDAANQIPDSTKACFGNPKPLNPNGSSRFIYQWSPAEGLDDPNAVNPVATVMTDTRFYVTITDTITDCSIVDSTLVWVPPIYSLALSPATMDTILCGMGSVSLEAKVDGGVGVSISWTDGTNDLGSDPSLEVMPTSNTTYTVSAVDAFNCKLSESIDINVGSLNVGYDIMAGDVICAGDEVNVLVTNSGDQDVSVEVNGTSYNVPAGGQVTITLTPEASGTFIFNASNSAGCSQSDSVTLDVFTFEPPVVATADPTTIVRGESSQLETNVDPNYVSYMWDPAGTLDNPGISNPLATPEQTTIYTVKVTDFNGCTGTDTVQVTVRQPECDMPYIFIPNAFTPNGDGNNDVLYVRGVIIDEMQLLIYNRWGEKVFESNIQSSGWDGTFKNKELPPDVYGYYLFVRCENGDTLTKKGNITLLR